jgi:hypothetical protein
MTHKYPPSLKPLRVSVNETAPYFTLIWVKMAHFGLYFIRPVGFARWLRLILFCYWWNKSRCFGA